MLLFCALPPYLTPQSLLHVHLYLSEPLKLYLMYEVKQIHPANCRLDSIPASHFKDVLLGPTLYLLVMHL